MCKSYAQNRETDLLSAVGAETLPETPVWTGISGLGPESPVWAGVSGLGAGISSPEVPGRAELVRDAILAEKLEPKHQIGGEIKELGNGNTWEGKKP